MAARDSYEEQQKRLQALFDACSTPESSEDPFADDGEFGNDQDYEPSGNESTSSDDATTISATRRIRQRPALLSSGESSSSSSSDSDDGSTVCPSYSEAHHEDIDTSLALLTSTTAPVTSTIDTSTNVQPSYDEQPQNVSLVTDGLSTSINYDLRESDIPVIEESWTTTVTDIPEFNFDSSATGITVNIDDMEHAIDFFHLVFPQNYIDYLVKCTNTYGHALCNSNRPHTRHSRKAVYRDTNYEEMMKFLGLSLLKGHIKCPQQRNLFSMTNVLYYHPVFNYTMSGRRYEQILRCLCASDLNSKGADKVGNFIDMLTLTFRKVYNAGEELSLDESLLLFRGRLHFRQYIKSKKARYGIKFYELTTHDGYVLNVKMYSGKEAVDLNIRESESKTEKLVLKLMRPYLLRGHHLFMDNFYNSVKLAEKLLDLKTHCTGTLRTNRKDNPKHIATKKLKRGEHVWSRKNKVYVSKWKDKRPVLMITTKKHPSIVEVQNRFGKSRLKPVEVEIYNRYMSGIDRSDQMISYYSCPRKTIRWYKKVLFHCLDMAVWNAFFLYRKYKKDNASNYQFVYYREELIRVMINLKDSKPRDLFSNSNSIHDSRRFRPNTLSSAPTAHEANVSETANTMRGHWPEKMAARPGTKKKFAFLKCKVCTQKNIRRETSYRCKGCPDKPPLCPSCFECYHENLLL